MTTMAEITAQVAQAHKVTIAEMKGQCRSAQICRARQCAWWRIRKELGHSLPMIGSWFGSRDHTTILSGVRKYQRLIDEGVVQEPTPAKPEHSTNGEDWTLAEYEQARGYREIGLSFKDIAALTGRSIGSVTARLSREYRGRKFGAPFKTPKKPTHANRAGQTEPEKLGAQNDAYCQAMHKHYPGKKFEDVKLRSRSRLVGQNGAQLYG